MEIHYFIDDMMDHLQGRHRFTKQEMNPLEIVFKTITASASIPSRNVHKSGIDSMEVYARFGKGKIGFDPKRDFL